MTTLRRRNWVTTLIIGMLLLPLIAYAALFVMRYVQLHDDDWIVKQANMKYCDDATGLSDTLLSCGASECLIEDDKISLLTANQQQQTVEIIKREIRFDLMPILHVKHSQGVSQYCFK